MTKEQAMEELKEHKEMLDKKYLNTKNSKAIEIVLSMLKEKDKQIDKLKKHNDRLLKKLRYRVKDVKKLQKYSLYKQEFSKLNKQLQNKDKIIDLMANEIDSLHYSLIDEFGTWKTEYSKQGEEATIEEVKQYFENKAKEV